MYAVLLAGGNEKRFRPTWSSVPKCMLPYFDRPVIEHQIERLEAAGIRDIVIATSYEGASIQEYFGNGSRWNTRISYSVEREPLGTAAAVKNVRHLLDSTFLVLYTDVITEVDIASVVHEHQQSGAIASIVVSDKLTISRNFDFVSTNADGWVTRFMRKPQKSHDVLLQSTGMIICEPSVLSTIPYFEKCEFETEVWPRLLNNGDYVQAISIPGYCYHISSPFDYRMAHIDALEGRFSAQIPGVQESAGVWIGEDAQVDQESILHPPLFIGNGSVVGWLTEIGASTVVGADCVIESRACVSTTILGAKSRVRNGAKVSGSIVGGGIDVPSGEYIYGALSVARGVYIPRSVSVASGKTSKTAQESVREFAGSSLRTKTAG